MLEVSEYLFLYLEELAFIARHNPNVAARHDIYAYFWLWNTEGTPEQRAEVQRVVDLYQLNWDLVIGVGDNARLPAVVPHPLVAAPPWVQQYEEHFRGFRPGTLEYTRRRLEYFGDD